MTVPAVLDLAGLSNENDEIKLSANQGRDCRVGFRASKSAMRISEKGPRIVDGKTGP